MKVISVFLTEEKYYTEAELKSILHYKDSNKFNAFKNRLILSDILRVKRKNKNEDDVMSGNDEKVEILYKLRFVGIITFDNRVVYIFPKYLKSANEDEIIKLKQILEVLKKYSEEKHKVNINYLNYYVDTDNNGEQSLLPIIFFLINDFQDNGELRYDLQEMKINGRGEPDWQRTVDEISPLIQNNRPVYTEIYSHENDYDDYNFFTQLHKYIIKDCIEQVERTRLDHLFSIPNVEIDDTFEIDTDDLTYILDKLDFQLSITYQDRELEVLRGIKNYLENSKVLFGENVFQFYGTKSFNLVWEYVCSVVFQDQKEQTITQINQDSRLNLQSTLSPDLTLKEFISKPVWQKDGYNYSASETLEPDFLKFVFQDGELIFYIMDAKYYCLKWENGSTKKISKQPGVQDIVKQYVYNLAYAELLESNGINNVNNYFIIPKTDDYDSNATVAKLDIFEKKPIELDSIRVRAIDPEYLFSKFLESGIDRYLPLSFLESNSNTD